jgi:protein CrcB
MGPNDSRRLRHTRTIHKKTLIPFWSLDSAVRGSMLRYSLSFGHAFVSFLTERFCQSLGCLALGAVSALAAKGGVLSPTTRLLLATGFCGGFTTMSTFTYETVRFVQDAEYLYAAGYLFLTLAGCLAFFCLGLYAVSLLTKG